MSRVYRWVAAMGGLLGAVVLTVSCYPTMPRIEFEAPSNSLVGAPFPELSEAVWVTQEGVAEEGPELAGKTLLVEFTASGCTACEEMSSYVEDWRSRYSSDEFAVVQVLDGDRDDVSSVESLLREHGSDQGYILDQHRQWFDDLRVESTPTFFLVSPEGEILWWQATLRTAIVEEWIEEGLARRAMAADLG